MYVARWHWTIRVLRAILFATWLWGLAVTLVFACWALWAMATECCSPVDYAYAVSYYQGAIRMGWVTQDEADRRLAAEREAYLAWAWSQAQAPILLSAMGVPFLTFLVLWYRNSDLRSESNAGERNATV